MFRPIIQGAVQANPGVAARSKQAVDSGCEWNLYLRTAFWQRDL